MEEIVRGSVLLKNDNDMLNFLGASRRCCWCGAASRTGAATHERKKTREAGDAGRETQGHRIVSKNLHVSSNSSPAHLVAVPQVDRISNRVRDS
jgi:hypothetical protein